MSSWLRGAAHLPVQQTPPEPISAGLNQGLSRSAHECCGSLRPLGAGTSLNRTSRVTPMSRFQMLSGHRAVLAVALVLAVASPAGSQMAAKPAAVAPAATSDTQPAGW